ncbi:MAG: hypothetical protein HYY06_19310 [Deltaproteobacteria bacterium]|nr:hypothetical protein [Deltaproteobacteria bacterium]
MLHPQPTDPTDVATRWKVAHLKACAFAPDREAVGVVHGESGAILEALGVASSGSAPDDLSDFSHREVIGLVVARSRQMAALGVTPGAAAAYVPTLASALGVGLEARLQGLLAVAMEAYVLARDERVVREAQDVLTERTPVIRIGDGLVACFLMGNPEPERVTRIVERLEREAFRAEARAILVDLGNMQTDPEALSAAFGADEGAKMLGVRCVFTGVDERVRRAIAEAGLRIDGLEVAASFEGGLDLLRRRGLLNRLLGR